MPTKTNQPQQEKNKDFGLPQVEFKPIEAGGGTWLKITAIIVGLVLLIGASFVYWFFYHAPAYNLSMGSRPMPEEQESKAQKNEVGSIDDDESAKHPAIGQGARASKLTKAMETLEGGEDTKKISASHATKPERGTMTRINTPRGCYYIVVGSFIDDDLASDYANKLVQQGVDVMLIAPPQGQYYFRIAIKQANTFRDAHEKVEVLKAMYGTDIWVMKY
jgi:hypothetical protein